MVDSYVVGTTSTWYTTTVQRRNKNKRDSKWTTGDIPFYEGFVFSPYVIGLKPDKTKGGLKRHSQKSKKLLNSEDGERSSVNEHSCLGLRERDWMQIPASRRKLRRIGCCTRPVHAYAPYRSVQQ